jgi:hypothetical protein
MKLFKLTRAWRTVDSCQYTKLLVYKAYQSAHQAWMKFIWSVVETASAREVYNMAVIVSWVCS